MRVFAGLMMLASGCASEPFELVQAARWRVATLAYDGFETHAADAAPCLPAGWGPELGGFEVDTGECPFAQLQQPALGRARVGDVLRVEFWHQTLAAESTATAHIALTTASAVLWERELPIPSDAQTYADEVVLAVEVPRDTPILLHLHNHGANTWNLFRVDVVPD